MIVGVDEAGRGPLLGRVYSAAVIINKYHPEITDSKKLSESKITKLADFIRINAVKYSIKYSTEQEIDEINILQATMKSMHECIKSLNITKPDDYILYIDGTYFKKYDSMKHICIPGGDLLNYEISCASILAKDARDQYIRDLCREKPILILYDCINNKGYGARRHIDAIKKYGITEYHRKTFGICKTAKKLAKIKLKKDIISN